MTIDVDSVDLLFDFNTNILHGCVVDVWSGPEIIDDNLKMIV